MALKWDESSQVARWCLLVYAVPVPTSACDQIRRKDRLSYRFDLWAIELTKVDLYTSVSAKGDPLPDSKAKTTFEVEVEIRPEGMDLLRREAIKVRAGRPNDFTRIATGQRQAHKHWSTQTGWSSSCARGSLGALCFAA